MTDIQVCDGEDSLWGVPIGAAAAVLIVSGFAVGCLCGGGSVWLLSRRAAKSSRQVEGGWRISAPAHTYPGKDSSAGQQGAAPVSQRKRQHTESIDDQTFAQILRRTVLVLGRAPGKTEASPSPGTAQVAPKPPASTTVEIHAGAQPGEASLEMDDMCMHGSGLHDSVYSSNERTKMSKGASTGPTSPIPEAASLETSVTPEQLVVTVESEYDLDDLDDDWIVLLHKIDERLMDDGKPTLVACERSVAIRSLLETPTDEDCDVALDRAIQDVTRFRNGE